MKMDKIRNYDAIGQVPDRSECRLTTGIAGFEMEKQC